MPTVNFDNAMLRSARAYAGALTTRGRINSKSARISSTIKSRVQKKGFIYEIRIVAGGKNAPHAAAREFGSKPHIIAPRNGKVLVFPWDKAIPEIPRINHPDGPVMLKKVDHPGSEAAMGGRGYIGAAIEDTRKAFRERLKKDGARGIRNDLRLSFKGAIVK